MSRESQKPLGGRYAEWTNGTYEVLRARSGAAGEVVTAPLPKFSGTSGTLVGVAPPPPVVAPPAADATASAGDQADPPPPSSRGDASQAESRSARRAVPIRRDPVFDQLLDALSYERPYVAEQKSETNGDPAAAYSAGPRALAASLKTPPLEARIKLSDSLVLDIDSPPRAKPEEVATPSPARRDVQTFVITRSLRRRRRPVFVVGALLSAGAVLLLALLHVKTPVPPSQVPSAGTQLSKAIESAVPAVPPMLEIEKTTSATTPALSVSPPLPTASAPQARTTSADSGSDPSAGPHRARGGSHANTPNPPVSPAPSAAPIDLHEEQKFKVEE